jgi:hypothetical protein
MVTQTQSWYTNFGFASSRHEYAKVGPGMGHRYVGLVSRLRLPATVT